MKKYIPVLFSLIFVLGFTLPFFASATSYVLLDKWGYIDPVSKQIVTFDNETACKTAVATKGFGNMATCANNPTISNTGGVDTNGTYYFSETVSSDVYKTFSWLTMDLCTKARTIYTTQNKNAVLSECKVLDLNTAKDVYTYTPQTTPPVDDGTYHLLAPIDGLTEITAADNIGTYFNKIYLIAIGLCAVLAVIMIVIGGIQYMGDESVFGKTEAKGQITKAILGLLIAIGAYALLNTIDPALLGKNGVNIAQVSAGIEEDVTTVGSGVNVNGTVVKIGTGSAIACKGGIVSVPSSLGSGQICQDLLTKLQILKSKMATWRITSIIRDGGAVSSCHYSGYANSGNCVDIQITNNPRLNYNKENGGSTNAAWGDFCVAVAQVGGLNFLNEASSTTNCQNLQPYKAYPQTTGPHLHINLRSN